MYMIVFVCVFDSSPLYGHFNVLRLIVEYMYARTSTYSYLSYHLTLSPPSLNHTHMKLLKIKECWFFFLQFIIDTVYSRKFAFFAEYFFFLIIWFCFFKLTYYVHVLINQFSIFIFLGVYFRSLQMLKKVDAIVLILIL